jgi:hypothetical protein
LSETAIITDYRSLKRFFDFRESKNCGDNCFVLFCFVGHDISLARGQQAKLLACVALSSYQALPAIIFSLINTILFHPNTFDE